MHRSINSMHGLQAALSVDVVDDHRGAPPGEILGDGPTTGLPGTGDEYHLAGPFGHRFHPSGFGVCQLYVADSQATPALELEALLIAVTLRNPGRDGGLLAGELDVAHRSRLGRCLLPGLAPSCWRFWRCW